MLAAGLSNKEVARYNQSRDQIIQSLNSLQTQIGQLDAQLAGNPANKDVVTAQRNGLVNQYQVVYSNFQQLASAGTPTSRLSTLESAQALPISQSEYQARLNLGQLGTNHLHAGDATATSLTGAAASNNNLTGPASRGALGALLGLLAGIGLAVVIDRLDRRIRNREEAEAAFDLPVLADVPRLRRSQERERSVVANDAPLSRAAEAYRAIRSSILFQHASVTGKADGNGQHGAHAGANGDGGGPLVVMITSAVPKEGKTTTTANLAAVFAEAGSSVLVVNCDFRRPTIHRHFGVSDEARRVLDTRVEGVKLVSSVLSDPGANPAQIVAAQRQVIAAARSRFDVILLDTAPLLTANDAVELVSAADLVLLVARSEATNSDNAQQTMALLTRLDAPVFGVVLVGASAAPNQYYYYYNRSTAREIARFSSRAGSNGGTPGEVSTRDLFGSQTVASTDER